MDRIAIMTDSVACLPKEIAERYHIHIVPAGTILFEGKVYRDWLDVSPEDVFRMLETSPDDFFTAATSPAAFLEAYQKISHEADVIVYISVSSKFTTLYNMARSAKELARAKLSKIKIELVDSRSATAAQGFIVLAAARAAEVGRSLADVIAVAEKIRESVSLLYVFETVRYLHRTGRVPKIFSNLGSKLNVRPIITVRNGSARLHGIARNKGRGIEHLVEFARKKIDRQLVHMAVLHAGALEEAEILKQRMAAEFNCVELWVSQFSPIMAYGTGRGVVGIAFYAED